MYSSTAFSFKFLFVLTVLIPGAVLRSHSYSYEGHVVSQCERKTSAFKANEKAIYIGNAIGESGHSGIDTEREEYEIEANQRTFECIGNRIQGKRIRKLERTLEYQKLKSECEFGEKYEICDASYPYRTFDGTCNNLQNVKWGSSLTCVARLFPTYYEGASGFRKSVCGTTLPNARTVSLNVFKNRDVLSQELNTIFTLFAQLIAHDNVDTPLSTIDGEIIDCCTHRSRRHPQCEPIIIPPNDPYYSTVNVTCLNFVRAIPCRSCSVGKRNTLDRMTSHLDCSFLYSSSEDRSRDLRKRDGTGQMMVQDLEVGELLSPDFLKGDECGSVKDHEYCFATGGFFGNQQTMTASFVTIFVREHNRIAGILKEINPQWREEKLFQETRKIVIAEYQVIVYKDLLPVLLGPQVMSDYELELGDGWSEYDPSANPTSYAEFNFAAYRLHSLLPTVITGKGADGGKRNLSEFVEESATPLYHGELENLLQGMSATGSGFMDRYSTGDVTETLAGVLSLSPEVDLLATDIQRGRDAGMPPYTEVIRHLSGGKTIIKTFDDLAEIFQPEDVELVKKIYCDPKDIDYYVGMHLERPSNDSLLRGSGAKIAAKQFSDWKYGDRFYFEHFGQFNKAQLRNLKEVTLATLICENTNLRFIQQDAFKFTSSGNPLKACEEIPKLDLQLWKANY